MTVRLAYFDIPATKMTLETTHGIEPGLLVSYVYLPAFEKHRRNFRFRDWVMDSGAFSAHNSGTKIDLQAYIEKCRELMAVDSQLTEVFALDVIGDWKASLKNCERMWESGVPAIPCYHAGEPEDALKHIAQHYPKIAIGGVVGAPGKAKLNWAQQCFARVWPKKIHGFGFGGESHIMALPFHSVDATNWETGPCKFGRWNSFGKMSVRGGQQNLRSEVEYYLRVERQARAKWKKEMELLDSLDDAPAVRLASKNFGEVKYQRSLDPSPQVKLALAIANPNNGGATFLRGGVKVDSDGNPVPQPEQ